jgi:hypothetical protein
VLDAVETSFVTGVFACAGWIRHENVICVRGTAVDPFSADETRAATCETLLVALLLDVSAVGVVHYLSDGHGYRWGGDETANTVAVSPSFVAMRCGRSAS